MNNPHNSLGRENVNYSPSKYYITIVFRWVMRDCKLVIVIWLMYKNHVHGRVIEV